MIQGVTGTASSYAAMKAQENKAAEKAQAAAVTAAAAVETEEGQKTAASKTDTFQKSSNGNSSVYSKKNNKLNTAQIQQLQNDAQARADNMTKMIQSMVVKQGQKSNLKLFGMDLFVTKEQSAKAAASIAEGGEYSVDAVATRIMDMAKALSGGDESKIELLRTAVQKGFKAAGVELGGKLPSISEDTYDEVMKRFDDWKDGGEKAVADSGAVEQAAE